MKDLVISSIDRFGWNEAKVWVKSLRESGFSGDVVLIAYRVADQALVDNCADHNVQLFQAPHDFLGNPPDRDWETNH